jgi:NAD(P)-dependent dehydrogenase (short-subunit alcohol dehydrogenase family)
VTDALPPDAPALSEGALRDRVVLVTGCTGGFGGALARTAARAGATLVLLGRKVPALERLYDELVRAGAAQPALYPLDLQGAGADDYDALAEAIGREFGALHGIVHSAAQFEGLASLELSEPLAWLGALHVNLSAPLMLTRACLPLLESSRGGVVFVLDDPERTGRALWGAYGIAKQALAGAVRQLDQECEHNGVRVHGFLPGPMRTGLRAKAYMAEDPARLAPPEAYAPACLWLLTEAAHGWRGRVADARRIAPADAA